MKRLMQVLVFLSEETHLPPERNTSQREYQYNNKSDAKCITLKPFNQLEESHFKHG